MARKTKDTPELRAQIKKHLELGMSKKDTIILAGISGECFYNWIKTNPDLSDVVERAEHVCKQRNIGLIQKHAIKDSKSAQWWLSRRYSDEFGDEIKLKGTGEGGSLLLEVINKIEGKTDAKHNEGGEVEKE